MSAGRSRSNGGSLVIVGSGIHAIGQFTLEAVEHIRQADQVYYMVAEPLTEQWIRDQQPSAIDLGDLYATGKSRTVTYIQMGERLLADVREGLRVVCVFYGHPGFFVAPTHRAIAIARLEGYDAVMLPAVSSLDCLYADLGVDPSKAGSQTLEATDMLLRKRTVLSDAHVVILQIGTVGLAGFSQRGYAETRRLDVFIDYLAQFYPEDFAFVHYLASQYPILAAEIDPMTLAELRTPAGSKRLNAMSTFYFPPFDLRGADPEMAEKMGVKLKTTEPQSLSPFASGEPYGPAERRAVESLATHVAPDSYVAVQAARPTYEFLRDLAMDPGLVASYHADPAGALAARGDLPARDVQALLSGRPGKIRRALSTGGSSATPRSGSPAVT